MIPGRMAANPVFSMYLTHIDVESTFIRLSGQRDKNGALLVESIIDSSTFSFDKGIGVTTAANLCEEMICVAKYSKDNRYYRAKILNPNYHHQVYVHFIDYGNKELVSIDSIRLLDQYPPNLNSIVAQAKDFLLARLFTPPGSWNDSVNPTLYDMVCNTDYLFKVEKQTANESFISFAFNGSDFAEHLARSGYGVRIDVKKQEEILKNSVGTNMHRGATAAVYNFPPMFPQLNQPPPPFQSTQPVSPQLNPEYGHKLVKQKQIAMVQQALAIGSPQTVGMFNKLAKNIVPPRPLNRSTSSGGQVMEIDRSIPQKNEIATSPLKVKSPRSKSTYKTKSLEINSEHQVYVSFSEDGPKMFDIQLESAKDQLQFMMAAINKLPLQTLTDLPSIGSVCLGRFSEDKVMCRAVVMGSYDQQCSLFFVDFGITEMVSYYDIFDIPEEYVQPNVFALRFCLSGIKELSLTKELIKTFKELVNNKQLLLKVVPPEGPPLIQYGELYINGRNLKDILKESCPPTQYKFERPQPLAINTDHSILVCFVDSCTNFYIQLSDKIDSLNSVMSEVDSHCKNSEKMEINSLKKGSACCALFPFDSKWYRAQVESVDGSKVNVRYIDYGNEQDVGFESIRPITPKLLKLKPQAIRCTLKGYEGQPEKKTASNQLEMLSLEKTLKAHIYQLLEDGSLLVDLLDESFNPPLDITKRMAELSKPRQSRSSLDNTEHQTKPSKAVSAQEDSFEDAPKNEKSSYERSDRPKYDRQEKTKSDRSERGERSERGNRNERGEKSDKGERTERGERYDRGERSERGDRHERGDRSERPKRDWDSSKSDWPKNDYESSRGDKPRRDRDFNSSKSDWPKKEESDWPKKEFDSPRPRKDFDSGKTDRPKRDFDSTNTFRSNDDFKGRPRRENSGRFERSSRNNESNEQSAATDSWGQNDNDRRNSLRNRKKGDNASRRDNNEKPRNLQPANERLARMRSGYTEWGSNSSHSDKSSETSARSNRSTKDTWGDKPSTKTNRSDFQPRTSRENNRGNSNRRETGSGDWDENRRETDGGGRDDNRRETGGGWDDNRRDNKRSEQSKPFSDAGSDKSFDNSRKTRSRFTKPTEIKTLPNPATPDVQFLNHEIELLSQHEISIPWFVTPHQFFIQLVQFQQQLSSMMHNIPDLYKGIKAYDSNLEVTSTVMARFPEDRVLYRASIVAVKPAGKYLVQFVDFGNTCEVDSNDIWQADSDLLTLPKMAVLCKLDGVAPIADNWPSNSDFESCFNAPRYQCIFHSLDDGVYTVSLYNNSVSVSQMLIERNLAISAGSALSAILKDEPIDLNMIVSQKLNSKVSHVVSMEKFFLQLDPSKAALVEEAIGSYQLDKLQNLLPERLTDGCHCIVIDDNKIYRAVLIDTSDKTNLKMVLPDVGREITTSSENVMTLPDDLTIYYYQSLECSLHNFVTGLSESLLTNEELKEKLQDKGFIVYIDDVIDGRLLVTLYDNENGAKLELFTPDEGAHPVVPVPCPHPVFNENFGVAFVSHVESLNEIYLQKFTSSDSIAALLDSLFEYYDTEGKTEDLTDIEIESVCAAKSPDGNWYRAIVQEINEENCQIQFIDYGNSERVPLSDLKKLNGKFNDPHELALRVTLGLESLNEESVSRLVEWTNDKNVQVTLIPGEEWLATLYVNGIDIGVKLVNENLAVSEQISNVVHDLDQNIEESNRTPGSTLVYITHIDTPGQFWLQLDSDNISVANLQVHLQEISETLPNLEKIDTGILCIAKYSADEQWYRAEILDSDNEIITVRFIDYGNTDVLDNVPGLIKKLPEELDVKERFSLKCSVNATPTGTGQWTEPASDLFTSSIGNLDDPVDALIILKDVTTYVDLYVNGKNITDILVSNGFASKSDREESGGMATCFASHINTPSEFWVQLESSIPELQLIENEMTAAENFPLLVDKEEGVICAAKYPEDELWYRAQIIINGSNGTEVLFMDYGNASLTTELRMLPEDLKAKPALSRKCALQKPGNIKMWPQLAEQKFSELAADGATIFNVQFIASGDISIVELYLNEMSVTDDLVSLCEGPLNTADRPSPIGQDSLAKGSVISTISPNDFYLRLEEDLLNLENVITTLLDVENCQKVDNIVINEVYAALWSENNEWYRAKILNKIINNEHEVFFIDFGNKIICTEFKVLPEEIRNIKPLILHCTISVGDDVCNSDLNLEFEELTADGINVFDVEILDADSEPILIKLFMDGENVATKLGATKPVIKQNKENCCTTLNWELLNQQQNRMPKVEYQIDVISEPAVSVTKENQEESNVSESEKTASEVILVKSSSDTQNVPIDLQVDSLSLDKNDINESEVKIIKTEAGNVNSTKTEDLSETKVSPNKIDNEIKTKKADNTVIEVSLEPQDGNVFNQNSDNIENEDLSETKVSPNKIDNEIKTKKADNTVIEVSLEPQDGNVFNQNSDNIENEDLSETKVSPNKIDNEIKTKKADSTENEVSLEPQDGNVFNQNSDNIENEDLSETKVSPNKIDNEIKTKKADNTENEVSLEPQDGNVFNQNSDNIENEDLSETKVSPNKIDNEIKTKKADNTENEVSLEPQDGNVFNQNSDNIENEDLSETKVENLVLKHVPPSEENSKNESEARNSQKTLEMQEENDKDMSSNESKTQTLDYMETEESMKTQSENVNQIVPNDNDKELNESLNGNTTERSDNTECDTKTVNIDRAESDGTFEAQMEKILLNQVSPEESDTVMSLKGEVEVKAKHESLNEQSPKTNKVNNSFSNNKCEIPIDHNIINETGCSVEGEDDRNENDKAELMEKDSLEKEV